LKKGYEVNIPLRSTVIQLSLYFYLETYQINEMLKSAKKDCEAFRFIPFPSSVVEESERVGCTGMKPGQS
jgi:hypothetical protein